MPRLLIRDLVRDTAGALVAGSIDGAAAGVSIDSRAILAGQAFFAIQGHHLDGHDFVADAAQRGAAAVVVSRVPAGPPLPAEVAVVLVDDTTRALQRLAAAHRERHRLPVVAVTGSNGKTTTKELAAAVLGTRYRVLKAEGSFNNQWGVSLTLLGLEPAHQVAVVELGMNAPGEIAALARLVRPTIGLVTTVGPSHLEGVGSLRGVQQAKAELVEAIPPDGVVILNADDPRVLAMASLTRAAVVTFGQAAAADVRLGEPAVTPDALAFTVTADGTTVPVRLGLPGRHNAWNATAAVAVGRSLRVPLEAAATALARVEPARGRLRWHEVAGIRILDDTYNASPVSLRAALEVLRQARDVAGRGRTWVILGDMLELGSGSEAAHREAGRWVVELPADGLVTLGPATGVTAAVAREAGCPEVAACGGVEEAVARVAARLTGGDRVLVKGSRGMRMERVVAALVEQLGREPRPC